MSIGSAFSIEMSSLSLHFQQPEKSWRNGEGQDQPARELFYSEFNFGLVRITSSIGRNDDHGMCAW